MNELIALPHAETEPAARAGAASPALLRQALNRATTPEELGVVCDRLDALYAAGALQREEVEALTGTAILLAELLADAPVAAAGVAARDLLPVRPRACPCCRATEHWYNHGVRTCAVCHPYPGTALSVTRTAA